MTLVQLVAIVCGHRHPLDAHRLEGQAVRLHRRDHGSAAAVESFRAHSRSKFSPSRRKGGVPLTATKSHFTSFKSCASCSARSNPLPKVSRGMRAQAGTGAEPGKT